MGTQWAPSNTLNNTQSVPIKHYKIYPGSIPFNIIEYHSISFNMMHIRIVHGTLPFFVSILKCQVWSWSTLSSFSNCARLRILEGSTRSITLGFKEFSMPLDHWKNRCKKVLRSLSKFFILHLGLILSLCLRALLCFDGPWTQTKTKPSVLLHAVHSSGEMTYAP